MIGRLVICIAVALTVSTARAQLRIPCDRSNGLVEGSPSPRRTRAVSTLIGQVRVPVILAAFTDVGFRLSSEETFERWDAMLNQSGYAEHGANGCVSDYFRAQSQGLFDVTFDLMGPVVLPNSMAYYGRNLNGREGDDVKPELMIRDACRAVDRDFSPYDWNGDGVVDVVLVVFAGQGENRGGGPDAVWPHKFTASGCKVGDLSLSDYACVSDLRDSEELDGYGTLCHEFSHCLGLPDLYPVSGNAFSIFDEWDLMDGGNYANNGYGIPNYSAFERYLCGWMEPEELSGPTTVTDMPSMDESPCAYIIRNDAHPEEYFLLENRQQRGFDFFVPGQGLLVTHVNNYAEGSLAPNSSAFTRIDLIPADNRNYRESELFFGPDKYKENGRNVYLSLAAYPYKLDDFINDCLTDTSVPAATLKEENAAGNYYLSKPVTNIRMDAQGHIAFDFMKETVCLWSTLLDTPQDAEGYYDLGGRRLSGKPSRHGVYVIRYADGRIKKCIR